jgi:HlyD family secretion protein
LTKQVHERKSSEELVHKLEQTLPAYTKVARAYAELEEDGFMRSLTAIEKECDATEKARELDAQCASVAALGAGIAAQESKSSSCPARVAVTR